MKKHLYPLSLILIGILAGLATIIFKLSLNFVHDLLFLGTFSLDYDFNSHTLVKLPGALVILVPVVGSLAVTFLILKYAPEAKGHGVPEVIDAIQRKRFSMRPIVALIKSTASAISMGSGGSSGTEGPIVQIGATLGSMQARYNKSLTDVQQATLISAGAAAGLGATFDAPISGILFAVELLLPIIRLYTILPVMVSTIIAVLITNASIGSEISLPTSFAAMSSETALLDSLLLGGITGIGSAFFIVSLWKTETFFENLKWSPYIKHALGMFFVGLILYFTVSCTGHYYVEALGYATIHDVINGALNHYDFLIFLFFIKIVATSLTLGSGASGGVLSPCLFMGACLGGGYHLAVQHFFSGGGGNKLNFVLAGMVGMLSGATGAVLTSVVLLLEISHCYHLAIPLLITAFSASIARKWIVKDSFFTIPENKPSPW